MVRGPMRVVLWILGTVGMLWLILGLISLPAMGSMMGGSGEMGGGMMGGGTGGEQMMGGDGMMSAGAMTMMGAMLLQLVGMLGLVGIFVYLVVDSVRGRPSSRLNGEP